MKNILFVFSILFFFISCKNEIDNPSPSAMKNLVVSPVFNWETSRQVTFLITSTTSGVIRITSEDELATFYKGFYNGLTEVFTVSTRIPSHISKVLINGVLVDLTGYEIPVDLTMKMDESLKNGEITRGMVSYWKMNENGGSLVSDEVGGNPGSVIGANWQSGINGSALDFNGVTDWVQIPEKPNLDITEKITLCAWVKTRENTTSKIAQKGDWDGYGIGQSKWTGWNCSMQMADGINHQLYWGQGIPILNEWYFLAFTYDGVTFSFYVNGQLKANMSVTGLLKNNNRVFSIGSDGGDQKFHNGLIDEVSVYNNALSPQEITEIYNNLPNVDSDGDGVLNVDDDYPEDPARAFNTYYPAQGFGSLAFEDLWPSQGDYDFNDLVLDYRFNTITNANNLVAEVITIIDIKAIGAGYLNGFGFQLGQDYPANHIQVSGSELTEGFINLSPNGTEANQNKTTIIVFDNAYKQMASSGGSGVNVNPDFPWVIPDTIRLTIDFVDDTYNASQIAIENWNPFLIENGNRGMEIHLANHAPTNLADLSVFGTFADRSNPGEGIYYKTENNLPWAIDLPVSFDYSIEKHEISSAHLKFIEWAQSSGLSFNDWFLPLPGYRDVSKIYQHEK